ncbi:MAG: HAD-IB family hydrolase [Burkholderiales bacterium]|jgi:HAD superfamily hydrolase (TIGR01490 family)|nr:HAD-IB family hydrolase [Burkholderiales bacterium]
MSAEHARVALFDMDDTLLPADSDSLWNTWLADVGAVDPVARRRDQQRFGAQYVAGTLDIGEFMAFQLAPLAAHPRGVLDRWRTQFIHERVAPILTDAAKRCVAAHAGEHCALVTATNRWIAEPVAALFGIDAVIATEPEQAPDGRFTGRVAGVPAFREGKITRVEAWLVERGLALDTVARSTFYSDSRNDIPLLERVTHPVAVDPDPMLAAHARALGWPVISLRGVTAEVTA